MSAITETIKTIVVFDLETTGLPARDGSTKITEISFVACSIEHLNKLKPSQTIPRVIHKLSLCLNPKRDLDKVASEMTGLDYEMLQHENAFTENCVNLINSYLKQLQQPICLIAHNGYRFDYPLLAQALKNVNLSLNENVLCTDSLYAFRGIERNGSKKGFKLTDVYEKIFHRQPLIAHNAEADVLILLQCIAAKKDQFIPFIMENHKLFSSFL